MCAASAFFFASSRSFRSASFFAWLLGVGGLGFSYFCWVVGGGASFASAYVPPEEEEAVDSEFRGHSHRTDF